MMSMRVREARLRDLLRCSLTPAPLIGQLSIRLGCKETSAKSLLIPVGEGFRSPPPSGEGLGEREQRLPKQPRRDERK